MEERMVKKLSALLFAAGIILGSGITSMGAGFQSMGYQAMSMGGAGVAYSNGSYAAYYNPALLASHKYGVEISVSPGVGFREHNLADHIDRLADIGIQDTFDQISNLNFPDIESTDIGSAITPDNADYASLRRDLQTIQTELGAMSTGNGFELTPGVGLGIQVRSFGFGAYGVSDLTASAVIDSQRLDIVVPVEANGAQYYVQYDPESDSFTLRDQAYYENNSLDYAIQEQTTTVNVKGVAYLEVPFAYGYQFDTGLGKLSLGGAVKIMSGRTYMMEKPIDSESEDILEDLESTEKKTTTFGLDAGAQLIPAGIENLSLGMVMKNINTPKFDVIDGSKIEFKPQVRIGAAYNAMLDRLTFAMDMDLTNNDGMIPGYKEQYIGGGVDFHPFSWFSVRAGMMKNLKESDEGNIMTAGLGFGSKWLQLDIAGQYSTEEGRYDGEKMPRYGRVQVSLVSRWF